jgi:hypothetical protein
MSTFTTRSDLNQESNDMRPICVRFKKVYTTNVKFYMINPNWTTQQFYEFIKPYVFIDFEILRFEIVEAGRPGSEQADSIRITNNITVNEMFANLNELTFYIRERIQ